MTLLWLLGLLIVLVGPSRVYLGHHWPSDVLAAYALDLAYLLVLIRTYRTVRLAPAHWEIATPEPHAPRPFTKRGEDRRPGPADR